MLLSRTWCKNNYCPQGPSAVEPQATSLCSAALSLSSLVGPNRVSPSIWRRLWRIATMVTQINRYCAKSYFVVFLHVVYPQYRPFLKSILDIFYYNGLPKTLQFAEGFYRLVRACNLPTTHSRGLRSKVVVYLMLIFDWFQPMWA